MAYTNIGQFNKFLLIQRANYSQALSTCESLIRIGFECYPWLNILPLTANFL
jgi:hypothetical protein